MSEINVISRVQRIIVEPASRSVAVINMGPVGPAGAPGGPGPPGESGGTILGAYWTYASSTSAPPSGGQMRTNSPISTLWLNEIDTDGYDRQAGLLLVEEGNQVFVRASNGTRADYIVTDTPVDNGVYWSIPVTVISGSGTVTKGGRCQVMFISSAPHGIPPGGADGQVLTKTAGTDYYVGWEAIPSTGPTIPDGGTTGQVLAKQSGVDGDVDWETAGTSGAPVRIPTSLETGTTYSPLVADENSMIKLSNAAAITVTLPSNTVRAIAIDAEFSYVWWGVGAVTFVAGSGATVDGTPGLKLRARYSACTAKKMTTDGWLLYGDLSA